MAATFAPQEELQVKDGAGWIGLGCEKGHGWMGGGEGGLTHSHPPPHAPPEQGLMEQTGLASNTFWGR